MRVAVVSAPELGEVATVILRLLSVSLACVELDAEYAAGDDVRRRHVSVDVTSGARAACVFPHGRCSTGESLGDPVLDEQVRERAAEEIIRLAAAVEGASG